MAKRNSRRWQSPVTVTRVSPDGNVLSKRTVPASRILHPPQRDAYYAKPRIRSRVETHARANGWKVSWDPTGPTFHIPSS